ncbi:MAG: amino acid adenylation domain-containing protein [Anaerolineales bacterium]|nr:amino acid adenylation domain-containing protein [Anaerolineales bacterium]
METLTEAHPPGAPPPAEVQAQLQDIIAHALGLDPADVPVETPLEELGASSLALVDAFRAITMRFGVRPSIRKVFEDYNSVERLAEYVAELLAAGPTVLPTPAPPERPPGAAYASLPLTAAQTHTWFLASYSDEAMLAHTHRVALQLTGALDEAALRQAWRAAADRHEALRLVFDAAEEQQRIALEPAAALEVVDFAGQPAAAVGEWLKADARRPFDPAVALWRVTLLRLASDRHLLLVSAHALLADEAVLHRLLDEVGRLYSGAGAPAEAVPFRAHADALAQQARQPQYQESRAYWSTLYADGLPTTDLAWWQPRPPIKNYAGARLVVPLPAALAQALAAWNAAQRSSTFATLLAAFQLWLQRVSGQNDLVVGVFSRGDSLLPPAGTLIANTTNPLPLRTQVDETQPFAAHWQRVQQALLAAFDHQDYPFAAIIHDLNPERDQSRSAIFTVAFDWQPRAVRPRFGGLSVQPVTVPVQFVPYDLALTVVELDGQLQLQCDYSTELFDTATIRRWMNSFRTLLAGCLEAEARPAAELPLLPPDEREQVLEAWNATARPLPAEARIERLFEAQAARTPQAEALTDSVYSLTYAELNARADAMADRLRQAGVGPGRFVGVCVDRSAGMVVCLLGILKAGGAYLPLDPAFPAERLAFILKDSQAGVLITEAAATARGPAFAGPTFLLEGLALRGPLPATAPAEAHPPADPNAAVLIYTSGSTGKPKGVLVTQRGVVNVLETLRSESLLDHTDRMLAVTTISFDISEMELFLTLAVGGAVVVASRDDIVDGTRLRAHLERGGLTAMQATPATWRMLLAAGWPGDSRLKMFSAGEALPRALAEQLLARGGALWNLYGPTETTIYSTFKRVEGGAGPVTIGRPLANTQAYVLDRHRQPTLIGVPGELYLGGEGVAPGYWQRPELTAERFVPNPFVEAAPGRPAPRLYRTGDLVRYLPDGDIAYLGRQDFQVKVNGYRIELGEVEAALSSHPAVERCVVVAREEAGGPKYLAGYFVPHAGQAAPTTTALRAHLAERLPEYMLPAAFVPLAALPQTPNGKIDRKALPAPDQDRRAALGQTYAAPRNRVEEVVCRIWAEVLGVERVGIHDNFFNLGGHSLLLTPLVLKLREYFRFHISMREFFAQPSVAELAAMIVTARSQATAGANGQWLSPTLRQDGPEAKARFDFLREQARLDPSIQPRGAAYDSRRPLRRLLMTGATGFVGGYLLRDLMEHSDLTVYALVRAPSEAAGLERVRQQAAKLGVWDERYAARLRIVPGDIGQARLGLSDADYARVADETDAILHSAAVVNFIYPFAAMKNINVDGVARVIELAFAGQVKPVHYLSTTAIWPMGAHRTFTEEMDLDQDLRLNLAYDETKWVAEKMLRAAAERGLPVAVYRPGEVSGDSRTGESDLSHLASALLKGSIQAGLFPALDSFIDAAPVDYVARAIVELVTRHQPLGHVYHLCNPRPMHAHDAFRWLREHGYTFEVLPFDEWRWRILSGECFPENALYPFAALLEEFTELSLQLPVWDTTATLAELAGSGVTCPALDAALADVYLRYFTESGYLPAAEPAAARG